MMVVVMVAKGSGDSDVLSISQLENFDIHNITTNNIDIHNITRQLVIAVMVGGDGSKDVSGEDLSGDIEDIPITT
jgi:RecJ-like exonuclease